MRAAYDLESITTLNLFTMVVILALDNYLVRISPTLPARLKDKRLFPTQVLDFFTVVAC